MKIKINNYTFNKTNKTVTFTDYTTIRLDGLLLITNVTRNIIIYNFANPLLGGTVANNVVTLVYDTTSMVNTDSLQIYYDDAYINPATDESILLLRRIVKELESNATVDRNNRQRVTIDAVQANTAGATTECVGTLPVSLAASAALGFQAGLNYGQPVAGITPYFTNSAAQSWYTPSWEGPVDQRWRVAEDSHLGYQIGIRNHLTIT